MKLYHFTDASNVSSIMKNGLLSWQELKRRRIRHRPGSNFLSRHLDKRKGLEDYVRLSACRNHPMAWVAVKEGRIKNLVWLSVADDVLDHPDVLFSDTNATAKRARINKRRATALNSSDPQAEVLVKNCVGPQLISYDGGGFTAMRMSLWGRFLVWLRRHIAA
jgi:hypothetical protein